MGIKERDSLSTSKKVNSLPSITFIVLQIKWIYYVSSEHLQPKVYNSDTDQICHPFESYVYIMIKDWTSKTAHPPDNKKSDQWAQIFYISKK